MAIGQEDESYGMVAAMGEANANATSSCLMMNGLSIDASEREVHILFNGCPGFMKVVVVPPKWGSEKKTYSFIQFDSQENAVNAGNSRQGTVWPGESQAVSIDMSKKNISDNIPGQQPQQPGQPKPAPSYSEWKTSAPPAKRLKQAYGVVDDLLPKTLYIGGLPGIITQADLEEFLRNNFGTECVGGKLSGGGAAAKGGCTARAFVGFVSNDSAATALAALYGFDWDGYTLHADWAKSEFTPGAEGTLRAPATAYQGKGQGPAQGEQWPVAEAQQWPAEEAPQWPPADADPYAAELAKSGGLIQRNLAAAAAKGQQKGYAPPQQQSYVPPQQQQKGYEKGYEKGGRSPNYGKISTPGVNECTLHFANLPPVSDEEFGVFVSMTFPDQVTFSRFVDNHDGRPPVAWVRFIDSFTAGAIAAAHSEFEWMGKQVKVQFAKSELDPNIAVKGKGKGK